MGIEGNGQSIGAKCLIPANRALVAIQLIAELAIFQILGDRRTLYRTYSIEVVAVVDGVCAAAVCQGAAVAVDYCAFLEVAGSIAFIECYTAAAV